MLNSSPAFGSLSTNDLEASKVFYSKVLGLKVEVTEMGILLVFTYGNQPTVIYPKDDHEPATFTVLNFPVDTIQETVDKLIAKGVVFEQYEEPIQTDEKGIHWSDLPEAPHIAWFRDPVGNILSVMQEK